MCARDKIHRGSMDKGTMTRHDTVEGQHLFHINRLRTKTSWIHAPNRKEVSYLSNRRGTTVKLNILSELKRAYFSPIQTTSTSVSFRWYYSTLLCSIKTWTPPSNICMSSHFESHDPLKCISYVIMFSLYRIESYSKAWI